jgi:beta-glucanase (GH16 family)
MKKHQIILLLLIVILGSCCTTKENKTVKKEFRRKTDWKIIWEDNFDGPSLDTTKWTRITGGPSDWNRHMTDDPVCYDLKEGKLFLKGIVNPDTLKDPRPYLTGGIYTKGKFNFRYGKVEIHAKLGCATGAWPAMWMLPATKKYGDYPRNGEIDIMEHLNYDDIIYQTVHSYYTLVLKKDKEPPHYGTASIDISKFNTIGLEWYPDRLLFTLNGEVTFTYPRVEGVDPSQWPFDQPFYLLIDQQLGGKWVGEIDPDDLPVEMVVDWVRVFQ